MVLLTAIYLGLSRRMWQKCTRINANFKATFDISIGEVNESRLNVHFGVIIRKVTSLLTLILVASVKNTKHHVALINAEDGMGGLDRKNLPEAYAVTVFLVSRQGLSRKERICFTSRKDAQGSGR